MLSSSRTSFTSVTSFAPFCISRLVPVLVLRSARPGTANTFVSDNAPVVVDPNSFMASNIAQHAAHLSPGGASSRLFLGGILSLVIDTATITDYDELNAAGVAPVFIDTVLGAIIRKGGLGMPVIASVGLFLIYYIISMMGEKFSREGILPPYIGMWLSTFLLAPLSFWLTQKAVKDSVVLNIETYFVWFKKFKLRLKKKYSSS